MSTTQEIALSKQERDVLNYMKNTGGITSRECSVKLGVCNLHPRITMLRRKGYNITPFKIVPPRNPAGWYYVYQLEGYAEKQMSIC